MKVIKEKELNEATLSSKILFKFVDQAVDKSGLGEDIVDSREYIKVMAATFGKYLSHAVENANDMGDEIFDGYKDIALAVLKKELFTN